MTRFLTIFALIACQPDPIPPESTEAVTREAYAIFPTADLVVDGRLQLDGLPQAETEIPIDRLAWRDGFSPVQTTVIQPHVALDPTSLPGIDDVGTPGSVQLWDLTDGVAIPCFAELDAWPFDNNKPRSLLVRPQAPVPLGHKVGVMLTSDVRTATGDPLTSPDWFRAIGQGGVEGVDVEDLQADIDRMKALSGADIVLAERWPVASDVTSFTHHLLDQVEVPTSWVLDDIANTDDGADLPDNTWQRIRGTYTVPDWLGDEGEFTLEEGMPVLQGEAEARVYVHIPESVRDAEPGTVPVWVFGHGIFAEPELYFDVDDDGHGAIDLANRAGVIVVATVWRGLTTADALVAVSVGSDFGTLPQLTDKLGQGVANTLALSRMVTEGDFLDDPALMGLPDAEAVSYYGISLGGIMGAALVSQVDAFDHAVLHVGGSSWSTMLERSSNWSGFEALITVGVPVPQERQLLYSISQLWWDPVDPINYAHDLQDRSVLWQTAIADDQVPNISTWTIARAANASLVGPTSVQPFGLTPAEPGVGGPAVTQFDPEMFNHEIDNRPSPKTRAHDQPRHWDSHKNQVMTFLDPVAGGVVEHFCDGVCGPPAE